MGLWYWFKSLPIPQPHWSCAFIFAERFVLLFSIKYSQRSILAMSCSSSSSLILLISFSLAKLVLLAAMSLSHCWIFCSRLSMSASMVSYSLAS